MPSLILIGVIIFTLALFAYSLVSHRIEGSMVTAPNDLCGDWSAGQSGRTGYHSPDFNSELILVFAEIALVLILFSDAAAWISEIERKPEFSIAVTGNRSSSDDFFRGSYCNTAFYRSFLTRSSTDRCNSCTTDAGLGQVIVNSQKSRKDTAGSECRERTQRWGCNPVFAFFLVLPRQKSSLFPPANGSHLPLSR